MRKQELTQIQFEFYRSNGRVGSTHHSFVSHVSAGDNAIIGLGNVVTQNVSLNEVRVENPASLKKSSLLKCYLTCYL